jgi:hypothetical protein
MPWIIRSRVEQDDETGAPLYWSNQDGWVDRESADLYTEQDYNSYRASPIKIIGGADWEQVTTQPEEVR